MKNTNIENLLRDIKKLEKLSHVNLDDVINKVTQEVWELIEANQQLDAENTYKEANDVMVNVLSVAHELNLDLDNIENEWWEKDDINLCILNSKWNQKIQWFRNRYTRENISVTEASDITNQLVKTVLNYSNPDLDICQMLEINKEKFAWRVDEYKKVCTC